MDWITGDKFISLADFTYSPDTKEAGDYDNLSNTLDIKSVRDGDIIYTHTIYARQLFEVIKNLDKSVKIITHNSDINVDNSFSPPECVYKWFSQNINVFHEKLVAIPIGLENDRWFVSVKKKEKMIAKMQQPCSYRNLVYINHNILTNPAQRRKPYQVLSGKPWATIESRANGDDFDGYLDNIYNHMFVICPCGNGLDTHRVWETLYMGSIPIVLNNALAEYLYSYFPVMIVNDWEEVTENSLNDEYKSIMDIKSYFDGDKEMLKFEYWKNKIHGEAE